MCELEFQSYSKIKDGVKMQDKGMDFKHKEVVNITNGKRLRICARCMC